MRSRLSLLILLGLSLVAWGAAGCGDDDDGGGGGNGDLLIPLQEGTWVFSGTASASGDPETCIDLGEIEPDTGLVCGGVDLEELLGEVPALGLNCDFTADANGFTFECASITPVSPSCNLVVSITGEGTYTSTTYEDAATWIIRFAPDDPCIEEFSGACTLMTATTGTWLVGDTANACPDPGSPRPNFGARLLAGLREVLGAS